MAWQKLGLLYCAQGEHDWTHSHAYIPTPLMLDDDRIRIFVAFLDHQKVGRVGYVDVDARDPLTVLAVSKSPVLDIGEPGTFDDSGVTPISLVRVGQRIHLYYVGWQLGVKIRYSLLTGLAISEDGGATFRRHCNVPLLERSHDELFVRSAANVHLEGETWKMWYVAGDRWVDINGKMVPTYDVRYMTSPDGLQWPQTGHLCLSPVLPDEYGFGRPFVVHEDGRYKMWYSVRTESLGYRLGYAESADGLNWERHDDESGLDVSSDGWDSEMVCFAAILETPHGRYMFYNGNNYGETGFGVAKWHP